MPTIVLVRLGGGHSGGTRGAVRGAGADLLEPVEAGAGDAGGVGAAVRTTSVSDVTGWRRPCRPGTIGRRDTAFQGLRSGRSFLQRRICFDP